MPRVHLNLIPAPPLPSSYMFSSIHHFVHLPRSGQPHVPQERPVRRGARFYRWLDGVLKYKSGLVLPVPDVPGQGKIGSAVEQIPSLHFPSRLYCTVPEGEKMD